ncbi:MAG: hypothetical protein ACYDCL_09085 [Myxococcales bacterium]
MSERAPEVKPRKVYRPPEVVEIVLDPDEAMMTSCQSNTVSTPPCTAPAYSVLLVR